MKKIYAAEYNSKSGKDLGFDTLMMADFDLEKVMNRAESDWRRYTTRREKEDRILYVSEYDYDETLEETPGEYDSDAVLWDEGGVVLKQFVEYSAKELRQIWGDEFIEYLESLDELDDNAVDELLSRAERYEAGITKAYEEACDDENSELVDSILDRAKNYLKKKQ